MIKLFCGQIWCSFCLQVHRYKRHICDASCRLKLPFDPLSSQAGTPVRCRCRSHSGNRGWQCRASRGRALCLHSTCAAAAVGVSTACGSRSTSCVTALSVSEHCSMAGGNTSLSPDTSCKFRHVYIEGTFHLDSSSLFPKFSVVPGIRLCTMRAATGVA